MSGTLDADYDFTFVKTQPSPNGDLEDSELIDLTHLFEFFCQPGSLKFTPSQQQFLNILIKVNTVKLATFESTVPKKKLRRLFAQPINKLLMARVKDTAILLSFYVTISLIAE